MLKKFKLLSPMFCTFLLLFSMTAYAGELDIDPDFNQPIEQPNLLQGYFFGIHSGIALPSNFKAYVKNGYTLGGLVGYRNTNYRTAIALSFFKHNFKSTAIPAVPSNASYNLFTAMANFFYDFNYDGIVIPFVGAGIGYLNVWRNKCPLPNVTCHRFPVGNKFAYQGIVGLGLQLGCFRLSARYRYFRFVHSYSFCENIFDAVLSFYLK
jgi:opacity protein-like surface antigen